MSARKTSYRKRSASRLAAVQALYQIDMSGASVDAALRDQVARSRDAEAEARPAGGLDEAFLSELVRGACDRRGDVDGMVEAALSDSWTIDRLEVVLRAILRAGAYELLGRPDIDAPVIISEYVEMAKAFFDGGEPKLVNGVLDRLAATLRPRAGDGVETGAGGNDAEDG